MALVFGKSFRQLLIDVALLFLFAQIALEKLSLVLVDPNLPLLIVLAKCSLDAVAFLFRAAPLDVSTRWVDWVVTLLMVFGPLAFTSAPVDMIGSYVVLVRLSLFMQIAGFAISLFGLVFLFRSWGLVPANRGIKTSGLYRFVRHPIYLGYVLVWTGFVMSNPSWGNGALLLILLISFVFRIGAEERLLLRDPAYQTYVKRTRWRVIPGIF